MQVIGSLELNKLYYLDIKKKIILISTILILFTFPIILLTLIWLPPYIVYGALYGIFALYLSYFMIELFVHVLGRKK